MRELSLSEIESVNGANDAVDGFTVGAAFGTVGGAIATGTTAGATQYGIIGGCLGFAFGAGYGIGTFGYNTWSNWYY